MSSSNGFFRVACADAARIVSILSLESMDITRPRQLNSIWRNIYEKSVFFFRFFYMVFYKGFTPTVFDLLPFPVWYALTIGIYTYRLTILPIILRITGYGRYASWTNPQIGSYQPKKHSMETTSIANVSLTKTGRLASLDFGDKDFELMLSELYQKTTHLSPHSQSPGHPLVAGFPGNFMDHLAGVYKILVAWKQPQYVARGGLFHSVYGTFDYRAGCFDLRDGRDDLRTLIGPAAEELAFAICTSDRLGLLPDLYEAMYGLDAISKYGSIKSGVKVDPTDGNPLPPLKTMLQEDGFPVRNHITQTRHLIPADFFAQFIVVFCADFMDQGALSSASKDMDLCLFQFLRYRFFNDLLRFVSPFLRVVPPAFKKHMWDKEFFEPTRTEIKRFKQLWNVVFNTRNEPVSVPAEDRDFLYNMVERYPYMAEPRMALACTMKKNEIYQGYTRKLLAASSRDLMEDWGTMTFKKVSMKDVLHKISLFLED